jgi:hypothetical protein
MFLIYPTTAIRYDHEGYCCEANNEATIEPVSRKQFASLIRSSETLEMFMRSDIDSLDAFLALFIPDKTEIIYPIADMDSGYCTAAEPMHFPHGQASYKHALVYILAKEGKRHLRMMSEYHNLLFIDFKMDAIYEIRGNTIAIARAFMKHVIVILAVLKRHGVVKPVRKLIVLLFLSSIKV